MKRLILLVCILLNALIPAAISNPQLADRVIAVVNDDVITQSEFDIVFHPIYAQIKSAYAGDDLRQQIEAVRLKLLNQMIEDKLVYQEATKLGIEISDAEIEAQINNLKSQFPDEATFIEETKRSGVTMAALKAQFRERLSITKLHQGLIRGRVIVSPTEVEAYYEDHQDQFITRDQVEVWSITIPKTEKAVKKGIIDEIANNKTADLLKKLKKGADFSKLAKTYSQDGAKDQGGALGFLEQGNFVDEIDAIIFSLPANSFSEVLETERGYHIFKIGERKVGTEQSFADVKDKIADLLFRQKAHDRFMLWMEDLKEKSYISIR